MNKLSKLLSVFILVGAVGASASFAAGCSHQHSFSGDWTVENGQHWHAATCEHTDQKIDLGDCVDEKINESGEAGKDSLCDICGTAMSGSGTPETPDTPDKPDKPDTSNKMTEANFKAAIDATLASNNFTYTLDGESVKVDGAKNAFAFSGGSYAVYDAEAKKLNRYSPLGNIAWEKGEFSVAFENFAEAKDLMTRLMSLKLNSLKADYASTSYDKNTGKYSVANLYVTFEGGKVSSFGDESEEIKLTDYGTTAFELPDFTNVFENIVSVNIAKNAVGSKLPAKTADSSFGLFADEKMATATDYVEATAEGYKQKLTQTSANGNGTWINFANLEGKIEGYFEFTPSTIGKNWDVFSIFSGGEKILSLRIDANNKFSETAGADNTAVANSTIGNLAVSAAKYKVKYAFEKDGASGNYKATIKVNDVEFVTNKDLNVATLEGFQLVCGGGSKDASKVRYIHVDNVIICGTPQESAFVKVENVTLNKYEMRIDQLGTTETLTATVLPADATNKNLVWSSSNSSVATVDANGVVKAVAKGDAIISVMASNGKTAQCKVSVGETPRPMYTVTFISDGEEVTKLTAELDGKVLKPTGVTKEGYTLKGWAVGSVDGAIYDFETPVEGDFTLYAVWEEGGSGNTDPVNPDPVNPDPVKPDPGDNTNPDEPVIKIYEDEKNGVQPEITNTSIWLSAEGIDSNDGSRNAPLYSLAEAVNRASAGTTIFCMPGVYQYTERVNLSKSGTAENPIIIQAYNWGEVEFNFSGQTPGNNSTSAVGLYLTGNYWKLHGITVCYAGDNGIKIEGSYNYLGRCKTHHNLDTGVQLGFGHDKKNPGGAECSNNLIENCDSYLNCDHDANFGADADGFACKMFAGINNAFRGCRAWRNADDNWDLYEMDYSVLIENCWAWEAAKKADFTGADSWVRKRVEPFGMKYRGDGSFNGNGNGIKLGGNSSNGVQLVKNCVSFGHNITGSVKGFDQNHNKGGLYITNCVAWDNGYNYMLDDSSKFGHTILNSLSFYYPQANGKPSTRNPGELAGSGVVKNCNFDLMSPKGDLKHNTTYGTLTADDFITLSEEAAMAPRQADGSLPDNGFAKLKATSPFYGKGMGLI